MRAAILGLPPQIGRGTRGIFGEGVGHGDQLDVLAGLEAVCHRAGAAAAAADQGNLQFLAAGRVGRPGHPQSSGQRKPRRRRAGLQKVTAGEICMSLMVVVLGRKETGGEGTRNVCILV